MIINNLELKQNLSANFMLFLNKSMVEFPDLELYNIVLQDGNSYVIKMYLGSLSLSQVKHASLLQDFLETLTCM